MRCLCPDRELVTFSEDQINSITPDHWGEIHTAIQCREENGRIPGICKRHEMILGLDHIWKQFSEEERDAHTFLVNVREEEFTKELIEHILNNYDSSNVNTDLIGVLLSPIGIITMKPEYVAAIQLNKYITEVTTLKNNINIAEVDPNVNVNYLDDLDRRFDKIKIEYEFYEFGEAILNTIHWIQLLNPDYNVFMWNLLAAISFNTLPLLDKPMFVQENNLTFYFPVPIINTIDNWIKTYEETMGFPPKIDRLFIEFMDIMNVGITSFARYRKIG